MSIQPHSDNHTWRDYADRLSVDATRLLSRWEEMGSPASELVALARQCIVDDRFQVDCEQLHDEVAPTAPRGLSRTEWWEPDDAHPVTYREVTLADTEIAGTAWRLHTIVSVSLLGEVSTPFLDVVMPSPDPRVTLRQALSISAAVAATASAANGAQR